MKDNRVLLVCNDEYMSKYLNEELTIVGGYFVSFFSKASEAVTSLKRETFELIIAEFNMPDMPGIEMVREFKKIDPDCVVLAVVEDRAKFPVSEASRIGVYDVIAKPINGERLLFLLQKGIELRALNVTHRKLTASLQEQNAALQKQNSLLAKRMEESTKNLTRLYESLRSTYMRTIKVLAQAIDARDHYTHSHSQNVAKYAVAIAAEMHLSAKEIEMIREACELHDLGKIGIVDSILGKPSSLTQEEWQEIRRHPLIAAQILEPLTFLEEVIDMVKQHHEHFDGSGYPNGQKAENILLGARIIHLADAYEAMTSARSYRKVPLSKEAAIEEIKRNTGTQFDPAVVEAFLKIADKI